MAKQKIKRTKELSPSPILDIAYSFRQARVLLTAFELGLFTALGDSSKESGQIARALGTSGPATERLMNALCGMGFLRKKGDKFQNTLLAGRYLVQGKPEYLGGLMHQVALWNTWSTLTEAVRKGASIATRGVLGAREVNWLEAFIKAMHMRARKQAGPIAKLIDLRDVQRVLDVGGGSAAFSMAFVRAKKGLAATVFDLPQVIPFTRKYIETEGLTDRIGTVEGDYEVDSLGSGFGLVFLSAIIHSNSTEVNRSIFKKASDALNPGGQIVVLDYVMSEDRTDPLSGALFSLNMLVGTQAGDTYTESEIREWMAKAGFVDIKRKSTPFETSVIIGRKKSASLR